MTTPVETWHAACQKRDRLAGELKELNDRIENGDDPKVKERAGNVARGLAAAVEHEKKAQKSALASVGSHQIESGSGVGDAPSFNASTTKARPSAMDNPFVEAVVSKMVKSGEATTKAFGLSGEIAVGTELFGGIEVSPRNMRFASQLFGSPEQIGPGAFSYRRQSTRTNLAAPVAIGALKPTSVYAIERVTSDVTTIAHLSDPIARQYLEDEADLANFISSEMYYGLIASLDAQLISGDGISPNLEGVLNTTGIQTQVFATSPLVSLRKGLTKLQTADVIEDANDTGGVAYVIHPTDWEAIELTEATGSGEYIVRTGPVDSAERRLWGAPVVVSTSTAVGTALLGKWSAARLVSRGPVNVTWTENASDDFERNLVRFRCEGRFGFGVVQPSAFVSIALTV